MISDKNITGIMQKQGMVPVFFHEDPVIARKIVDACYEGGLRIFEFTNRGKNAAIVFEQLVAYCRQSLPDMIPGAGSIINGNSAEDYIALGAEFIVSPLISDSVIDVCKSRNCFHIPGCGTVTEVGRAQKSGADVVKLFPADVLGPGFIKALRGPMPWSRIMPTGGVTCKKENLQAWFDAGAFCVGMGSSLFNEKLISDDTGRLSAQIREVLEIIAEVRSI